MKTKEYLAIHPHADFWEVYENVLKTYEGNLVENTVSPRVFECAAHRTAMILFPGEYSGLVEPWVHYIPLQKDFSNMEEVVAALHDTNFLKALTERAYNDLIRSGKYSYQAMIQEFDQVIEEHLTYVKRAPYLKIRFWLAQNERLVVLFLQRLFGPIYSFLTYAPKKVAKSILPKPTYEKLRDVYRMVIPDRKL
jgi:hypothetical protein